MGISKGSSLQKINGYSIPGYNSPKYLYQTEAIFRRASTEGFTVPDDTIKRLIDNLIRSMIQSGIWDKLAFYYLFAHNNTALANFSKINWITPFGTLLTSFGTTAYTTQGWRGNALDGYLDTGIILSSTYFSSKFTQNNAMIGNTVYQAYSSGPTICASGTQAFNWLSNSSTANHRLNSSNSLPAAVNLGSTGFKGFMRDSSTVIRIYNKLVETASTQTSTGFSASTHCFFKRQTIFGDCGLADGMAGLSWTATDVANYSSYLNIYLTARGLTAFA